MVFENRGFIYLTLNLIFVVNPTPQFFNTRAGFPPTIALVAHL